MDFALALGIYLVGAVTGALILIAWLSDDVRVSEPTEDGRSPL